MDISLIITIILFVSSIISNIFMAGRRSSTLLTKDEADKIYSKKTDLNSYVATIDCQKHRDIINKTIDDKNIQTNTDLTVKIANITESHKNLENGINLVKDTLNKIDKNLELQKQEYDINRKNDEKNRLLDIKLIESFICEMKKVDAKIDTYKEEVDFLKRK